MDEIQIYQFKKKHLRLWARPRTTYIRNIQVYLYLN